MKIAILLYEDMTALDAIGPYEVLSRLPGAQVLFTGEMRGPVLTDTGFLKLMADYTISEVTDAAHEPGFLRDGGGCRLD